MRRFQSAGTTHSYECGAPLRRELLSGDDGHRLRMIGPWLDSSTAFARQLGRAARSFASTSIQTPTASPAVPALPCATVPV